MTFKEFIVSNGMSEVEAMNRLQDHGIVSDNAVWADDVAACDHRRAIGWLKSPQTPEEYANEVYERERDQFT